MLSLSPVRNVPAAEEISCWGLLHDFKNKLRCAHCMLVRAVVLDQMYENTHINKSTEICRIGEDAAQKKELIYLYFSPSCVKHKLLHILYTVYY